MPDPKTLKIGDRIRFVALPEEWNTPGFYVPGETVAFMEVMISRGWPSRVHRIDEYGIPWIRARIRVEGGIEHHDWAICENTGWRLVRKRLTTPNCSGPDDP
jgi:hypothetical protein